MTQLSKLFFIAFAIILAACSQQKEENSTHKKLKIVATTSMIKDAVVHVVNNLAEVEGLMGPGVDPHLYKPTPSDFKKIRQADIIFYNGLHLEGKMGEIFEKVSKEKPIFPVGESINTNRLHQLSTSVNFYDPHIWFDVTMWIDIVKHIGDKMAQQDPNNAAIYQKNAATYIEELKQLHSWTTDKIASIPVESRVLVTAHDAFEYFGRAYDIEVKGLQGISTIAEASVKDVTDLVDFITNKKIKALFIESSIPERTLKSVVDGCTEKGHDVKIGGTLFSDAMGEEGTPEGTYVGMVKANVTTIVEALK